MNGWEYDIRPADPGHRADAPEAHEVVGALNGRTRRVVGVWKSKRAALAVAVTLNLLAKEQIR